MKFIFIKITLMILAIFSGLVFSAVVQSEESAEQKITEPDNSGPENTEPDNTELKSNELQRKLKLRDDAIIELLERVESLERRVGIQHAKRISEGPSEQQIAASKQTPGKVVVNEDEAERALERSLTLEGALLLPSGVLEVEPGFAYSRREDTAPRFATIGTEIFPTEIELNANIIAASLALRLGLPWNSQIELSLPYRRDKLESVTNIDFVPTSTTKQSNSERGDISIGIAKTLFREQLWLPDVVGRFTFDTDSGSTDSFQELRWSLTAIKRQDPVTFIGGVSYQRTWKENEIGPGSAVSANFGSLIALSPETSIRFLISSFYQNETLQSGSEIDGSDRTAISFVIGGSTLIAPGTLLQLSVGIGLTDDADDFSIALSLPIRLSNRLF